MKSLVAAFFFCLAALPALAGELTVLSDYWCPFSCLPGNQPGYVIEIAKAVFEPKGVTVRYEPIPWEQAIRRATVEKGVALAGCAKAETPNLVFPKTAVGVSRPAFYVQSGSSWRYQGVESLEHVRLGVAFGYDYGEAVNRYIQERPEKVSVASSEEPVKESLRNLSLGHVDAIVGDPNVVLMTAGSMGMIGRIQSAGEAHASIPIYLGFSPAEKESLNMAALFDEGMRELRSSGKLASILAKYGLTDWTAGK